MVSATKRCFVSNLPPLRALFYWRVELSPLTSRGWAFQGRLLSRRVVHFCSDVVLFECNTFQASELHPYGMLYDTTPYTVKDGRLVKFLESGVLNPLWWTIEHNGGNFNDGRAVRGI